MEPRDPIRRAAPNLLGELARLAVEPRGEPLPLRLLRASTVILGADGAAITLANTAADRMTLCVTDEIAARLEDLQEVMGEGPGEEAFSRGLIVDAFLGAGEVFGAGERRWARFADPAVELLGELSILAVPIRPGSVVLGVLTAYSRGRRPPRHDLPTAQFLVNAVGVALIDDAEAVATGTSSLDGGPWTSRDQIHQATGMVIAQLGISSEDALALLRAHAYAHDHSLADISKEVVARRLDFSRIDLDEGTQP